MPTNLDVIRGALAGVPMRVSAAAMGKAVAVTDDEVVTARAGLFGRWGRKIERYPLHALAAVTAIPNPSASLLTLEFQGQPPSKLMLMFEPTAQAAFHELVGILEERLGRRDQGGRQ